MPATLDFDGLVSVLRAAAAKVTAGADELGRLDSAIGDGDHGVAMTRAMEALVKGIEECSAADNKSLLEGVAWSVMSIDAGSTGPLLGSLLMGMVEPVGDAAEIDATLMASMCEAGLAKLQVVSKAKVGDKTMIDTLVPAVDALKAAAAEGEPLDKALERAAAAGFAGAESTKDMQAKFGKARNLGERSIGYQDPGATSMAMLFAGLAEGAASLNT